MTHDPATELIDHIYAAAESPPLWQGFVDRLSHLLGDAAVAMSLSLPDFELPELHFRVHQRADLRSVVQEHLRHGLPWGTMADPRFGERFVRQYIAPDELRATALYRDWMQPQGLACEGPFAHRIAVVGNRVLSAIALFRREAGREITPADTALCDRLVPHLRQAYEIHRALQETEHERRGLSGVIDRIPIGVLLLDPAKKLVLCNATGSEILAARDGISLVDDRVVLSSDRENADLQAELAAAAAAAPGGGTLKASRPSGRRAYVLSVHSLRDPSTMRNSTPGRKPVVSLLVTDPEAAHIHPGRLRSLYDLTPAEEELVRLIVEGLTVEEAAARRGVTVNTARSQMKTIYSKTGAHRIGELLQLVLGGVGRLHDR